MTYMLSLHLEQSNPKISKSSPISSHRRHVTRGYCKRTGVVLSYEENVSFIVFLFNLELSESKSDQFGDFFMIQNVTQLASRFCPRVDRPPLFEGLSVVLFVGVARPRLLRRRLRA